MFNHNMCKSLAFLLFLCIKTNFAQYDNNVDYMKREHSLVKPYQGNFHFVVIFLGAR